VLTALVAVGSRGLEHFRKPRRLFERRAMGLFLDKKST
jgi:hypothetical protein